MVSSEILVAHFIVFMTFQLDLPGSTCQYLQRGLGLNTTKYAHISVDSDQIQSFISK